MISEGFDAIEPIRLTVGMDSSKRRLDEYLADRLSSLSRMRIASLLAEGACVVNGVQRHAGYRVVEGDQVELLADTCRPSAMTPEALPIDIVYEDDDLIVVDKPAGILVHPTRGTKTGTLVNRLSYYLNRSRFAELGSQSDESENNQLVTDSGIGPETGRESSLEDLQMVRPGVVHRLDRATSGLLVVAKTQHALSTLASHFHRRLIRKRYVALVHGRVEADEMVIVAPIGRDPETRPQWRVLDDGKPAETRLRVMKRREEQTVVELEPVTGRTNQLRIHCAYAGHVIVGDRWYGDAVESSTTRLCLHATLLGFFHPSGRGWMEFKSAAPFE